MRAVRHFGSGASPATTRGPRRLFLGPGLDPASGVLRGATTVREHQRSGLGSVVFRHRAGDGKVLVEISPQQMRVARVATEREVPRDAAMQISEGHGELTVVGRLDDHAVELVSATNHGCEIPNGVEFP